MLVLINGASGAGKTFLLERLHRLQGYNYVPIKKYTTRSRRVFETDQAVDLVYDCEETEIKNLVYNYPYKGEWYGIDKTEILHEMNHGNIPVIIVRSFEIIHKIKEDFDDVRVFFIVGASGATLKEKLLQQGRQVNDIDTSDEGVETIIGEYVTNIEDIDHCILNCLYNEELYIKQFLKYAK